MPIHHNTLLQLMKSLGYKINETGMCFGFAHMGMQAILAGDLQTYNRRLALLEDLYLDKINISNEIKWVRDKVKERKPDKTLRTQKELDLYLTELEKDLLSIPAFFEGVTLYYSPFSYPDIFEEGKQPIMQNAELTFPRVLSQELTTLVEECEHKYQIETVNIEAIDSFSGIYNRKELHKYFETLREAFSEQKYDQPISFILRSSHHAITVGYDPKQQSWQWIDASEAKEIKGKIVNEIMNAFSSNNISAFSTEIYVKKPNSQQAKNCLSVCQEKKTWQNLHCITREKVKKRDSDGVSWLYITAKRNQIETMKLLLAEGADPNQGFTRNGVAPLHWAAYHGNIKAVSALLEAKANPNQARVDNGLTPLCIATQEGNFGAIYLLCNNGANPNQPRTDTGETPLHKAACNNDINAVILLLEAKADIDATCTYEVSLLKKFAEMNHKKNEMEKLIKKHDISEKLSDLTALHLAALFNHPEIVQLLLDHDARHISAHNLLPRDFALVMGNQAMVDMLDEYNIKKRLQEAEDHQSSFFVFLGRRMILKKMRDEKTPIEIRNNFFELDNFASQLIKLIPPNIFKKNEKEIQALKKLNQIISETYHHFYLSHGKEFEIVLKTLENQAQLIFINLRPPPASTIIGLFKKPKPSPLYHSMQKILEEHRYKIG
ncbi:MAG: ankyrin [uncultured bacterium]|nr:MAG: ankyrin [uncultured bacterium]